MDIRFTTCVEVHCSNIQARSEKVIKPPIYNLKNSSLTVVLYPFIVQIREINAS